jgi:hypothetical protein
VKQSGRNNFCLHCSAVVQCASKQGPANVILCSMVFVPVPLGFIPAVVNVLFTEPVDLLTVKSMGIRTSSRTGVSRLELSSGSHFQSLAGIVARGPYMDFPCAAGGSPYFRRFPSL